MKNAIPAIRGLVDIWERFKGIVDPTLKPENAWKNQSWWPGPHDPGFPKGPGLFPWDKPGAEPRRYSTWLADAIWATHQVHPDKQFLTDLFPDLRAGYQVLRQRHAPDEQDDSQGHRRLTHHHGTSSLVICLR